MQPRGERGVVLPSVRDLGRLQSHTESKRKTDVITAEPLPNPLISSRSPLSHNSAIRPIANGESVLQPDSQRFTVENVTPTFAANCSWVRPNLARNSLIIFATSFLFLSFVSVTSRSYSLTHKSSQTILHNISGAPLYVKHFSGFLPDSLPDTFRRPQIILSGKV